MIILSESVLKLLTLNEVNIKLKSVHILLVQQLVCNVRVLLQYLIIKLASFIFIC